MVAVPDAQTHGSVTVRVYVNDALAENIAVYYHEPDGSYIGSVLTDSNGEAVISDMPAGGAVTVPVTPFSSTGLRAGVSTISGKFLTTITGVHIGDVLTVGRSAMFPAEVAGFSADQGDVSVTMPGAVGGATRYELFGPCDSTSTSTAGQVLTTDPREGCIPSSNSLDLVAYAEDTANDNRLAYAIRNGVTLSGTAPNLTGSTTMPAWQTDLGSYTVNVSNAPQADLDVDALFLGFRGGFVADNFNPGGVTLVNAGDGGALVSKSAPNFFDDTFFAIALQLGADPELSLSLVAFRDDSNPTSATPVSKSINLSTEVIGNISAVATTGAAGGVTWTAGSLSCKNNPAPDTVITMIQGQFDMGSATQTYNWIVMSPGDTASGVKPPQLDPGVAQVRWPESDFTSMNAGVLYKSHDGMTYDDWRTSDANFSLFDYVPQGSATVCLAGGGLFAFF